MMGWQWTPGWTVTHLYRSFSFFFSLFFFFFCCQAIQFLKYGSSYSEIKVWENCKESRHLKQGQCPSGLFPRLKGSKTLLRDGVNMFSSLRNSPQGMGSFARQQETDKQLFLFPQSHSYSGSWLKNWWPNALYLQNIITCAPKWIWILLSHIVFLTFLFQCNELSKFP